ncbi:MAG: hypothetical protein FWH20_03170 [Oscillospiraceae bacterium]|nr:hypothetical protein [Oscillospiraceae bacterium]
MNIFERIKASRQASFAKTAINSLDGYSRYKALKKLTDQFALADVAINAKDWRDSESAMGKITDQSALTVVAKNTYNFNARLKAAIWLKDRELAEKVFIEVATNGKYDNNKLRIDAAQMLSDKALAQKIYGEIAKKANKDFYDGDHKKAVDLLTDQTILVEVAESVKNFVIKEYAIYKLTDKNLAQKMLINMFNTYKLSGSKWDGFIIDAVHNNVDKSVLTDVKNNAVDPKVRAAASEGLSLLSTRLINN